MRAPLTPIYYDQRIRLEGYDRMMDAAGVNAPLSDLPQEPVAAPAVLKETQA